MPLETYTPNQETEANQQIETATRQETRQYIAEVTAEDFFDSKIFEWQCDAEDELGVGLEENRLAVVQKIGEKASLAAGEEPNEAKSTVVRLYGRIAEAIVEQDTLDNAIELPDSERKQLKYNMAKTNDEFQKFARANPEVDVTELAQSLLETASPLLNSEQAEETDEFIHGWIKGNRYEMALQDYAEAAGYEVVKSTPSEDRKGIDLTLHDPETGDIFQVDAKASIDRVARSNKHKPDNEKKFIEKDRKSGKGRIFVPARDDMFDHNGFFLKKKFLEDDSVAGWLRSNLPQLK